MEMTGWALRQPAWSAILTQSLCCVRPGMLARQVPYFGVRCDRAHSRIVIRVIVLVLLALRQYLYDASVVMMGGAR